MGREVVCTARLDGQPDQGKALLETVELVFRGTVCVRVPFAAIQMLAVSRGILRITWGDDKTHQLALVLGDDAAAWEAKIKNPPSRLDKLGVKPGLRVAVVGEIDAGALRELKTRTVIIPGRPRASDEPMDMIFLAVETAADLALLSPLAQRLVPAGALWVVRRKGKDAPVSERQSMAAGKAAGLVDTKVVGFSATHTAERYVIPVAARAKTPGTASVTTKAKPGVKLRVRPATKSDRG